jgi:hypothetical protein
MFKSSRTESVEEFLARGGKIKKIEVGDCTRKRVDKMKRLYARLVKNDQLEQAERVRVKIEEYTRKEFNPWYAEKK